MGYLFKAVLGAALFDGGTVLGGTIVGITFLVMGVPAMLFALWSLAANVGDRDERPAAAPSSGLGGFGRRTTSMSEMMRGAQSTLGAFGSPTDEEFQREKAKVLSGM